MRKTIPLLFGLGGFLLIAGLIALLWAPGVVKRTPLDTSSVTHLTGEAEKLNTATGRLEANDVKAISTSKTDSNVSDDEVAAWTSTSCLVIDDGDTPDCVDGTDERLVTATTDVFATDRLTALATNEGKYLPAGAKEHEGVVNKWPFDTEQKTYPYWDGTAGQAVDAKYVRTVKVRDLETYLFRVKIEDAPIQIAEGVDGTYDDVKELYVNPSTGAIINQTDSQQRSLANGAKVLDLKLAFTDAQVKRNVDKANGAIGEIRLITVVIPAIGILGGLMCLAGGAFLLLRGRPAGGARRA